MYLTQHYPSERFKSKKKIVTYQKLGLIEGLYYRSHSPGEKWCDDNPDSIFNGQGGNVQFSSCESDIVLFMLSILVSRVVRSIEWGEGDCATG